VPTGPAAVRTSPRQRWVLLQAHPQQAEQLASAARLPLVLAELLVARGITEAHAAFAFLNPDLSHLHDPFLMLGMTAAVERLDAIVAGVGSAGTVTGLTRYFRNVAPNVEFVLADPVGSILRHYHETRSIGEAHPYKIEGVGEDFIPTATDFTVIDRVLSCGDRDGLNMARRLAREEAIFVGGSGGMATWVALQVAKDLPADGLVVVLLPDTGERYLTKVHSDEWMRDNHLLDPAVTRVEDVVGGKRRHVPRLLSVQAGEPLRKALALVEQHDVTQIPVFRGTEVVGTVYDSEILKRVLEDSSSLDQPVETVMAEPLPVVRSDEAVEQVTRQLASRIPAVLVSDNGKITGILTRFDMLQFIAGGE